MARKDSEHQKKSMSMLFRGKAIFKPLNTGRIDAHVSCVREWMPDLIPRTETQIEYWYGEKEKKARKVDIAYACRAFPQTVLRQMDGMAHGELAMVYPERFYAEAMRFLGGAGAKCNKEQADEKIDLPVDLARHL